MFSNRQWRFFWCHRYPMNRFLKQLNLEPNPGVAVFVAFLLTPTRLSHWKIIIIMGAVCNKSPILKCCSCWMCVQCVSVLPDNWNQKPLPEWLNATEFCKSWTRWMCIQGVFMLPHSLNRKIPFRAIKCHKLPWVLSRGGWSRCFRPSHGVSTIAEFQTMLSLQSNLQYRSN